MPIAFLQFFFLAFEPVNLGLQVGEVERLHRAVVGVAFDSFEQVGVFGGDGFDPFVDPLRQPLFSMVLSESFGQKKKSRGNGRATDTRTSKKHALPITGRRGVRRCRVRQLRAQLAPTRADSATRRGRWADRAASE